MAAADVLFEVMTLMVKKGPLSAMVKGEDGEAEKEKESAREDGDEL